MTELFGRQVEIEELQRVVRGASAGAGGVVLVEGVAGIGKTALLDRVAELASTELQAVVRRGRAWEEGGAPPYWPWREIAAADGWALRWEGDDPFGLYDQVLRAAAEAAGRGPGPLVLVLDDLHAADADTVRLTRYVARSIAGLPIALVIGARPAEQLSALARLATRIDLAPLDDASAEALIGELVGASLEARRREEVRSAAEGNPLFLRELARSATSGRPVPADLLAVVSPTIDAQPVEGRALIEIAAVLGRSFRIDRLAAVAGQPVLEVLARLEPLRRSGLLAIEASARRGQFSHQLVRDVLYGRLAVATRLDLHRRAAAVMAAEDGTDLSTERARHLLAAVPLVTPEEAVQVARRAAAQARAQLAFADAAELLEAAVAHSAGAVPAELLLELGGDLREAGQVGRASAAFDRAIDAWRAAGDAGGFGRAVLARTDLVGWDLVSAELVALVVEALARLEEAIAAAAAAAPAPASSGAGDQGDDALAALVVRLQARRAVLGAIGTDFDGARRTARQALEAARALGSGHDRTLADALAALHRCCWAPDHLEESLAIGGEWVEVCRRSGDVDRLAEAMLAELIDHYRAGDLQAADAALERYGDLAARTRRPRLAFFTLSRRAMRAFLAGRLAEGQRLIERAYELGQRIEEPDAMQVFHGARLLVVDQLQDPADTLAAGRMVDAMAAAGEARLYVFAAHAYRRGGDLVAARRALDDLDRAMPSLTLRAMALFDLCLMAEVAAACAAADIAGRLRDSLLPFAGAPVLNAGAVTFGGVVDDYLGVLAASLGLVEEARAHLSAALARYRGWGARVFEARVVAALAALDGAAQRSAAARAERTARFCRRGDGWELGFVGNTFVLRDARGLAHLHRLLQQPGREVASVDLVGPHAGELAAREAHHALLDDRAKRAYRQRIRDLQDDLDEADATADIERSARLRAELDLLLDELRRAVGLGGRDRLAGDGAERARVAVRKAIDASLQRLADHDVAFADHLRSSIHTGHRCLYRPDPLLALTWQLEAAGSAPG